MFSHSGVLLKDISVYVTYQDGEIIFSHDSWEELILDNIFNFYSRCKFKNRNESYHITTNIRKDKSELAEYTHGKKKYFVGYKAFDDFYIFSIVPKDISYSATSEIVLLTSHVFFVLFVSISILFFYIFYTKKKHARLLSDSNEKLKFLLENIPGGVLSRLYDEDLTLEYMSCGFFELAGYKPSEIKAFFDDKFVLLIYPDDLQRVKKSLSEQLEHDNKFQIEYRITKQSGEIIWISERGQVKDDIINSVLLDIKGYIRV